ncbi:MAG: hypothetical protein AAFR67_02050, partial [Chloroflexota bacterium]
VLAGIYLIQNVAYNAITPFLLTLDDLDWLFAVQRAYLRMLGREDTQQKLKSVYDEVQDAPPVSGL